MTEERAPDAPASDGSSSPPEPPSTEDIARAPPTEDITKPPEPVSEAEARQPLPSPPPAPVAAGPEPAPGAEPGAEDTAITDGSEEPEPVAAEPAPSRGRRDVLVDVLAVSTVVLLVATILLGLMAFAPRTAPIKSHATRLAADALESEDITDVAKRFARNFLTVDYRTIDADIKRLTTDATGDFREQISQVLKLSREQFEKRKATSEGKANEAVLLFKEGDDARVQVLAERTIRNVRTKERDERPETKVLDIALVKTSSGWKVDNVREVQVQGQQPGAAP